MSCVVRRSDKSSSTQALAERAHRQVPPDTRDDFRRSIGIMVLGLAVVGFGCAQPFRESVDHDSRIDRASHGIADDPLIQAHRAGVEAARAREDAPSAIDEFQVRLREGYDEQENDVRLTTRVPIKRPGETRAQREVFRAETELAVSKLEEASLERRAELCFPSMSALAYEERLRIYTRYANQREVLFVWNEEWRNSGMVDELRATRFELESKTQIATRKPTPTRLPDRILGALPTMDAPAEKLVLALDVLRQTIGQFHPSVGSRRAAADRYRALADRAEARRLPWIRFVDLSYEHSSDGDRENGFGGQLAFSVPVGRRQNANLNRFRHLVQQESAKGMALMNEQLDRTLGALLEIRAFESEADRLRELEELATKAETIAEQWRRDRLATPSAVAALLDEALAARNAVIDARERAAVASCELLATSGVSADRWPRQ